MRDHGHTKTRWRMTLLVGLPSLQSQSLSQVATGASPSDPRAVSNSCRRPSAHSAAFLSVPCRSDRESPAAAAPPSARPSRDAAMGSNTT